MLKSNGLFAVFSFALVFAVSACCHHDDDDDGGCPDLTVQEIDLNSLNVVCPGGAGTCVTTVSFTIENIGDADAGPFNIRVVLDPSSSVELNEFVNAGLDAGASLTVTVVSQPGGNCFDPDCTISVTVDNEDIISECDETNNQLSDTLIG